MAPAPTLLSKTQVRVRSLPCLQLVRAGTTGTTHFRTITPLQSLACFINSIRRNYLLTLAVCLALRATASARPQPGARVSAACDARRASKARKSSQACADHPYSGVGPSPKWHVHSVTDFLAVLKVYQQTHILTLNRSVSVWHGFGT